MQSPAKKCRLIELDVEEPIWDQFFWVAPLVLIGTREADGSHDLEAGLLYERLTADHDQTGNVERREEQADEQKSYVE